MIIAGVIVGHLWTAVREDEEGPQEGGRVAGVRADLGQDAPGLEVGEPVLAGGAFAADQPVRFLLGIGELVVPIPPPSPAPVRPTPSASPTTATSA
jgi:hypothetical protein